MSEGPRWLPRPSLHVTAAATASTVLIHLPIFLLGGLAVLVRQDIEGFDEARLGVAVSIFYATSAIASVSGGKLAEARGPRTGMIAAALIGAVTLLGLGTATSLPALFGAAALGGVANGVGQPASNLGLARGVRAPRRGFAFGIKQSSVPLASLLAGISVPVVGLTLGWRWTFAAAVGLVLAVIALVPRRFGAPPGPAPTGMATDAPRPSLVLLAAGAGFGAAAANSLAAFAVLTAVAYGVAAGPAGYLLAIGSIAGVASRITTGWRADRRGHAHLPVVARMLGLGSLAYLLIAAGEAHPVVLVVGIVTAFATGWGWPGLLAFAVVRLSPATPGLASGVVLTGATTGSVVGPLLFGFVARDGSFTAAWVLAAVFSAIGAGLVLRARRTLWAAIDDGRMHRPPRTPPPT